MNNEIVSKKLSGMISGINDMPEKEKAQWPSEEFGRDYNKIRQAIQELNSNLATLLPPPVGFYEGQCQTRYYEIYTYCKQMYELIN